MRSYKYQYSRKEMKIYMAVIQDLVLTFCPTMRCVPNKGNWKSWCLYINLSLSLVESQRPWAWNSMFPGPSPALIIVYLFWVCPLYNSPAALVDSLPLFLATFWILISPLWLAINGVFICCVSNFQWVFGWEFIFEKGGCLIHRIFFKYFFYYNMHIRVNFVNTTLITQLHGYRRNKSL